MYKDYNMTQLTLPMETSILIPTNDISRHVNNIVETIPKTEFNEFRHHRGATSYHPSDVAITKSKAFRSKNKNHLQSKKN